MKELVFTLAQKLIDKKLTISGAESCAGGMIVSELVSSPGISAVLNESYVTYSNEAKIRILGVKPQTIEKFGAVSAECVKEMALGLKEKTGTDICFAVSGIAGPDGGTEEKPVGTVFFAVLINKDNLTVWKEVLSGDRNSIRKSASESVLNNILNKF
jgi:PncC family amidohydrolase